MLLLVDARDFRHLNLKNLDGVCEITSIVFICFLVLGQSVVVDLLDFGFLLELALEVLDLLLKLLLLVFSFVLE